MTNKEILNRLPIGEVVPKRILAAMKRKGLIYDYSAWGYLESARISYKDPDDSWHKYIETFPKGNAKEADDFIGTSDELREKFGFSDTIEYLGDFFETKYFSGCFSPYLVKCKPPMKYDMKIKKYRPTKRIYYKSFKGNVGRMQVYDDLGTNVWRLFLRQKSPDLNHVVFKYVCKKKLMFETSVRKKIPFGNHRMCLWGAII